jgi:hypothetical protein
MKLDWGVIAIFRAVVRAIVRSVGQRAPGL